jgi:orotate phosphoribosyltransferase
MYSVKLASSYVENLKADEISLDNIVVEHRHANSKRDFLFVNKNQCKHIPSSPSKMVEMCSKLGDKVTKQLGNKKVLIVGFAETATAIGSIVADRIKQSKYIMHTTRETVRNSKSLLLFSEEHSHATEQKLLTYDSEQVDINEFDYILFVEDEISTGQTILNFINAFESNYGKKMKYGVASICNWQDVESRELFKELRVDVFELISGNLINTNAKMNIHQGRIVNDKDKKESDISLLDTFYYRYGNLDMFRKERLGRESNTEKYRDLANFIKKNNLSENTGSIRVVGTEEFMYVPIMVGKELERYGHEVICHATTRSKIDVLSINNCGGIKSRAAVKSVYEEDRETYLYNTDDKVETLLIITDSTNKEQCNKGLESIVRTLDGTFEQAVIIRV